VKLTVIIRLGLPGADTVRVPAWVPAVSVEGLAETLNWSVPLEASDPPVLLKVSHGTLLTIV
jgi:hypothetical protein